MISRALASPAAATRSWGRLSDADIRFHALFFVFSIDDACDLISPCLFRQHARSI